MERTRDVNDAIASTLTINGREHDLDVPPFYPLAVVLREELGLTGTKTGCFEGRCGACTVSVDGETVVSCIYPVGLAYGKSVRTVEGLAHATGPLTPLQQNFLETGAVQCGICTPGMLMTLTDLLDRVPKPSEDDVRDALAGNLCRCTGYRKIIEATLATAEAGS
jgi:aerobic-type carbon monoxide dehydrogenase small subunit (CoxS/CutS family)